jgi:DnaK suppressor protein
MALTPQESQELRSMLESRRRTLVSELREDARKVRAERFSEVAGEAPDNGDESVAALIADLDQAEWSRDLDELRSLDAARERISAGDYGVCIDCGGDIDVKRLRATPTAIRCIDCQSRHERTFAGPGVGPSL